MRRHTGMTDSAHLTENRNYETVKPVFYGHCVGGSRLIRSIFVTNSQFISKDLTFLYPSFGRPPAFYDQNSR